MRAGQAGSDFDTDTIADSYAHGYYSHTNTKPQSNGHYSDTDTDCYYSDAYAHGYYSRTNTDGYHSHADTDRYNDSVTDQNPDSASITDPGLLLLRCGPARRSRRL